LPEGAGESSGGPRVTRKRSTTGAHGRCREVAAQGDKCARLRKVECARVEAPAPWREHGDAFERAFQAGGAGRRSRAHTHQRTGGHHSRQSKVGARFPRRGPRRHYPQRRVRRKPQPDQQAPHKLATVAVVCVLHHCHVACIVPGRNTWTRPRSSRGETTGCAAGPAQPSTARHGTARHGTARHGTARHGTARHGTARHGTARHGTARHGMESRAMWGLAPTGGGGGG
jgi:hypothetical protein